MAASRIHTPEEVDRLIKQLHTTHEELFAFSDAGSDIEIVTWRARVRCRLPQAPNIVLVEGRPETDHPQSRPAWFPDLGLVDATVRTFATMEVGRPVKGPAIVESGFTTVVVDPGATVARTDSGSLIIRLQPADPRSSTRRRRKADA